MIDKKIHLNCTGCSACVNSCPKDAITLKEDKEGFWYPYVDYGTCISCQKCVNRCPSLQKINPNGQKEDPTVYAAWNTDEDIRINSTSGGVFTALAQAMIQQGGVVVGAHYTTEHNIEHTLIDSAEGILALRQSKYAQSDIGYVFREVKTYLDAEKTVLFCGTPCQTAGLKSYLAKPYKTLYCCDFICRGVISPKVYRKFLNDMGATNNSRVSVVHFKNKDFGWNRFSTKLSFDNGAIYHKDRNEDYYMRGYLRYNLYLRPSCHQCQYKTLPRVSDISLGDFWGIGNYKAELDNEKGTSVVLINSDKGQELFARAQTYLYSEQRSLEEVVAGNSCLFNAAQEGKYRQYFFDHMDKYDFKTLIEKIDKKATKEPLRYRILTVLWRIKTKLTKK